jgi:K(+)-stimulated pyrophosphate-energized sodium pump
VTLGTELLWIVPTAIVIAIIFAFYLLRDVLRRDRGSEEMSALSDLIYVGAVAFLRRQYTKIGILAIVTAFILVSLISLFYRYI